MDEQVADGRALDAQVQAEKAQKAEAGQLHGEISELKMNIEMESPSSDHPAGSNRPQPAPQGDASKGTVSDEQDGDDNAPSPAESA